MDFIYQEPSLDIWMRVHYSIASRYQTQDCSVRSIVWSQRYSSNLMDEVSDILKCYFIRTILFHNNLGWLWDLSVKTLEHAIMFSSVHNMRLKESTSVYLIYNSAHAALICWEDQRLVVGSLFAPDTKSVQTACSSDITHQSLDHCPTRSRLLHTVVEEESLK